MTIPCFNKKTSKFQVNSYFILALPLLFALVLVLNQTVSADETIPLKKLIVPAYVWPPFNILNDNGEWSGADIDITKHILKRMGYDAIFVQRPFKRILKEMREGKHLAMVPCVEGGGREDYMLFSDPVSTIYSVLWKQKNDAECWSTYDDLIGKTIGASPYHYGAGFFEAAKMGKFNVQAQNIEGVVNAEKIDSLTLNFDKSK
jgi:ABC-type amino acid transport substrate-binding protein